MLNSIIRFSIKRKLIILLFTLGIVIGGVWSAFRLPIDAVPDITNNQVQIITVAPSQSALDIERLVTFPVEQTMATIPRIREMRSFSRFGLSVVTLVFGDKVDVYWARQQVNERLLIAKSQIPAGVGNPEMAPVTTGLGEIYQYILRPEKGYEKQYDAMQLRTIQDWIVRRQLLGTPGVADVASFGGLLKQYEIAINPDKLRSYNLSIADLFAALERNNQNTGGAYIDRKPNVYFIRSEGLVGSLDDIRKIVIRQTPEGIPLLVRDVADVQFGHAVRYGAMTYNSEGEVTGAVVMMLKGENSNAVVQQVKQRIEQIRKTLPKGVEILPFLDRSALVGRAIGTVEKNLVEGALIVIFVLVLFLGNFRAGLLVASVIPLSMLFAIIMMQVFGVSGNLMSLGAIDFGLIVDGAVIIVEAVLHRISRFPLPDGAGALNRQQMDDTVYGSASKLMNAAAFGQIIILIVYLPILALVGIEGKMFSPMAQTVVFAILGALLLSLTYVPMMSTILLSRKVSHRKNFSDRMMEKLQQWYLPVLALAIKRKKAVILAALLLFVGSAYLFTRMGGEFIPTLDEGDFAVETRTLTGSSLSETIEASQKAAAILQKEFPDEVQTVVGKIGSSEIPTDPMPIEACDLMVILKQKSQWKKARDRDALAEKMGEALEAIPGVSFGFQQPIQMRFNELISGVRQDVAVKIFGEDLEVLSRLAEQVGKITARVDGAKDIYVEKITGLPQIVITLDRDAIAKFGADVATINQAINSAFAGQSAGMVYEGEKRFDLVVRLNQADRTKIEDVANLYITTPSGNQVLLRQLADISFKVGANQIQREDAKRRIIIGFNVRGRDVASVVKELQEKIAKQVKMLPGYYTTFGGQFENLREANARLAIAVPAALALIFLLLYFAFGSLPQAFLIFSAIPMAAIGGVFALLLRGLPFSISAGVGFIALFGVAVLNGIVLIAEFNQLKKEGAGSLKEIVLKGTNTRLRPVLMTAAVASLGFLPMALATSAGAEVQRPLATVVIGGLVTSTILTLLVLPCLYLLVEQVRIRKPRWFRSITILLLFLGLGIGAQAQPLTLETAVQQALARNRLMQGAALEQQYQRTLKSASGYIGKTDLDVMVGQYNSYHWGDNNLTLTQVIPNPRNFSSRKALGDALIAASATGAQLTANELTRKVKETYYALLYSYGRERLLLEQDSLYTAFLQAATLRWQTGEGKLLEKTTAETQLNEVRDQLAQNRFDIRSALLALQQLTGSEQPVTIVIDSLQELPLRLPQDSMALAANPMLKYLQQQIAVAEKERDVTAAQQLPDFKIGYFNQSLMGTPLSASATSLAGAGNRFMGFTAGVALSIFNKPLKARIRAAEINTRMTGNQLAHAQSLLETEWQQAIVDYEKQRHTLAYYRQSALPNASLMMYQARRGYQSGDAGYAEYLLTLRQALQIREDYLRTLYQLTKTTIRLEFLAGSNSLQ